MALAVMQILLVLVSWIINSASPELPVRSLLSSEGIRWFFGHFTENMATPLLVWILLLSISYGMFASCGLKEVFKALCLNKKLMSRQRFSLWLVFFMFIIYMCVIVALTCIPNAILLSATGHLFPGSFSKSIVPVVAFGIMIFSLIYGTVSGTMTSLTDILRAMKNGIIRIRSLLIIYILAAQFYFSLLFVFSH